MLTTQHGHDWARHAELFKLDGFCAGLRHLWMHVWSLFRLREMQEAAASQPKSALAMDLLWIQEVDM